MLQRRTKGEHFEDLAARGGGGGGRGGEGGTTELHCRGLKNDALEHRLVNGTSLKSVPVAEEDKLGDRWTQMLHRRAAGPPMPRSQWTIGRRVMPPVCSSFYIRH
jgi:hypothetical protein